jgi:hypothetical protein
MKQLWRLTVIAFFIAGAVWVVWPAIHGIVSHDSHRDGPTAKSSSS